MANLDITTLSGNLRAAAEIADTRGANATNGKLDSNEITIFVTEAKKSGCEMTDIMNAVNQVGVDKEDETAQAKMQALQEIDQLEKKIAALKTERYNRIKNNKWPGTPIAKRVTTGIGTISGMAGGGYLGGLAVGALGFASAWVAIPVGIALGLGGALGGAYVGNTLGDKIGNLFESDEQKAKREQYENYQKNAVKPLEYEIEKLEEEMEAKLKAFYNN